MINNRLLDKREVCQILKISIGSLDRMMKRKEINYIKFDRSVRFRMEEVKNLIIKNLIKNE